MLGSSITGAINNVGSQLVDKYIYKKREYVRVTADGVKKRTESLQQLATAYDNYLITHPDDYCDIAQFYIGTTYFFVKSIHYPTRITMTIADFADLAGDVSTSRWFIRMHTLSTQLSRCRSVSVVNGSFTDDSSHVDTSGTEFTLYFNVYNKIS